MQGNKPVMGNNDEMTEWVDPAIKSLKDESSNLSAQIDLLEKERADLEKIIHLFEVRHTQELGDLVLRILDIKRTIAAKKFKQQPYNSDVKEEYEQAAKDEAEFKNTYEDTIKKPIPALNADKVAELKDKRNRIANLIHPDKGKVDAQYKEEAEELMRKTNEAYKNNDLKTISEILDYVENGKPFKLSNETSTESEALKAEIKYKQSVMMRLQQEINDLKNSETYYTISGIDDWNQYFTSTRTQFKTELEYLENLNQ